MQYLTGYDLAEMTQVLSTLPPMSEEDSNIISTLKATIEGVSVRNVEDGGEFDFSGVRLDWVRLQVRLNATDSCFYRICAEILQCWLVVS